MKSKQKKILFFYPVDSPFVKTDQEILSKKFVVIGYKYIHKKSIAKHFTEQIRLAFFLISHLFESKASFIWFADYHSFLPILLMKIFNKKSFLVLGGYDVTYIKEFNYGSFNNPIRAFCARYSIQNATGVFAVSENIRNDALEKVPNAKIKVIYTGYSNEKFTYEKNIERDGVLSVLGASTIQRLYIKGGDLLFETAKLLPEIKFTLVAVDKKLFISQFGELPNMVFVDKIPQKELIEFYRRTQVYAQFSRREGLPNSLCEAMLCGAIPVGLNVGGIPEAIGKCGFIIDERDARKTSEAIKEALKCGEELRKCARERISENFPLRRREKELIENIEKYLL